MHATYTELELKWIKFQWSKFTLSNMHKSRIFKIF